MPLGIDFAMERQDVYTPGQHKWFGLALDAINWSTNLNIASILPNFIHKVNSFKLIWDFLEGLVLVPFLPCILLLIFPCYP